MGENLDYTVVVASTQNHGHFFYQFPYGKDAQLQTSTLSFTEHTLIVRSLPDVTNQPLDQSGDEQMTLCFSSWKVAVGARLQQNKATKSREWAKVTVVADISAAGWPSRRARCTFWRGRFWRWFFCENKPPVLCPRRGADWTMEKYRFWSRWLPG